MERQEVPVSFHITGDRSPIPPMVTPMPSKAFSYPDKPTVSRMCSAPKHADSVSSIAQRLHAVEHYQFRVSATCVVLTVVNLYVLLERLGLRKLNLLLQLGYIAVGLRALPALCAAYMCWTRLPDAPQLPATPASQPAAPEVAPPRERRRDEEPEGRSPRPALSSEQQLLLKYLSPRGLEAVLESQRLHREFALWTIGALLLLSLSDLCLGYADLRPLLHLSQAALLAKTGARPPVFGPSPPGVAGGGFAVYPPAPSLNASPLGALTEQLALLGAYALKPAAAFCLLCAAQVGGGAAERPASEKGDAAGGHRVGSSGASFLAREAGGGASPPGRPLRALVLHGVIQVPLFALSYLILMHCPSLVRSPRPALSSADSVSSPCFAAAVEWLARACAVATLGVLGQSAACAAKREFCRASPGRAPLQPTLVRRPARVLMLVGLALLIFSAAANALTAFLPYARGLERTSYVWWLLLHGSIEERTAVCADAVTYFIGTFLIASSATTFGVQNHLLSLALRGHPVDEREELNIGYASAPTLLIAGKPAFRAGATHKTGEKGLKGD
ncbi:hypothetical protein BESB_062530 [Besnoitia besnoiti]|uniref:Transmembrane protein n=1 Tax=Besnoitia besnoiti TaxID=94643 RepID=A0A2A9MHD7_BESBE|nr:hypothetical protein BESB_062530 [Besnoitia besnoiti]PFH35366.1 hypothetical protein BESB_062530 [Besnoitia besnoiti]